MPAELISDVSNGLNLLVAAVAAKEQQQQNQQQLEEAVRTANSVSPTSSCDGTNEDKSESYWNRRRRNNEAARKSREKRRMNDLALESKLMKLSAENQLLKTELVKTITVPSTALISERKPLDIPPVTSYHPGLLSIPPAFPYGQFFSPLMLSSLEHFGPHSNVIKAESPDTTSTDSLHSGADKPLCGKEYLRYKLLEKQSRMACLEAKLHLPIDNSLRKKRPKVGLKSVKVEVVEDSSTSADSLSPSLSNSDSLGGDQKYLERRKRNNEAAKRCRANRRALFELRYRKTQELEEENSRLKEEMKKLAKEFQLLKELVANRGYNPGAKDSDLH